MSDSDFSPLSQACARALSDKIYEKRKTAALEVEKMVKDFLAVNNTSQIRRLINVLNAEFCQSHNSNNRKGGLIGLASVAIALGGDCHIYIKEIIEPVVGCFRDQDSRVRYFASEALYNVLKVTRGYSLECFNMIFSALANVTADQEQSVKNGAELGDRLLKDIVTESPSFNLEEFIPLLRERIYATNKFARQFILSWVSVLESVPGVDLLEYLPELIDGLLEMLKDSTPEIKKSCEKVLHSFLNDINSSPESVNFPAMINILVHHAHPDDELLQLVALQWIRDFVKLSGEGMLSYLSGILCVVLPSISPSGEYSNIEIQETGKEINEELMKLLPSEEAMSPETTIPISLVVEVLLGLIEKEVNHQDTRMAALQWLDTILDRAPKQTFVHMDEIFPVLMECLSDVHSAVINLALQFFSVVSDSPHASTVLEDFSDGVKKNLNVYFVRFMRELVEFFKKDRNRLEERGERIIRPLCVLMKPDQVYSHFALLISRDENLQFGAHFVRVLSLLLLTAPELFTLRMILKELNNDASLGLFSALYRGWVLSPVSTLALCLISQRFEHAAALTLEFANLDVTEDLLAELDRLIQLIETPVFIHLRLQMLECRNSNLVKALYGMLMIVPQTSRFHVLRRRLKCVPPDLYKSPVMQGAGELSESKSLPVQDLMNYFRQVQDKKREYDRGTLKQSIAMTTLRGSEPFGCIK
ncbi:unnamed protein product [Cyprideis torosa]|uniref:Protein VAC14 homolog n=1 Tax=Cyprideis torosa TaxID=163714 RepID=A0A7R8WD00_9CRUS|nr:unnamed protein product [Cyprideis torosa]CAG0894108.1 unnamed protein product [Cyprideis torosa]